VNVNVCECLLTSAAQLATVARAGEMYCRESAFQEEHVSGEVAVSTVRQSGRRGWFVFLAVYSFILA
jgi:hypothetical protein